MNLNNLKNRIQNLLPDYTVDFDEQTMLNKKADEVENTKAVYIEEYRSGYYREVYSVHRETTLDLYFFWTGDGDDYTAEQRENFREELEKTGIEPVLNDLYNFIPNIQEVRYNIGPSRFDIYEVGITVTIKIREEIC